jgi:hypothetical protein
MPTCFVIQPFDSGKFDKRFEQIFKPAITAAGLEPYRVDQDVRVNVPIDAIEGGIRAASVCLADITTDNPNVWYELGYAFASKRPTIMVCSTERESKRYPFDIQHRAIILYAVEAPDDFARLQVKITSRIQALLETSETLLQIGQTDQVAPLAGLSQPELTVLATLAGSVGSPDGKVSVWSLQQETERANLTKLGFAIGLRRLRAKTFVQALEDKDWNGDVCDVLALTERGWDWIEANESRFVLRRVEEEQSSGGNVGMIDDDIPF